VVTISLRITNRLLSKLKSEVFCRDYKKTQQEVSNIFLYYLHKYRWSVLTINNPTLMSIYLLWGKHAIDIYLDIILSVPSSRI